MPCSIWMPPWASGPVFTVKSPILTGVSSAIAGIGRLAAKTAPAERLSNVRRETLTTIAFSLFAVPTAVVRPPATNVRSGGSVR